MGRWMGITCWSKERFEVHLDYFCSVLLLFFFPQVDFLMLAWANAKHRKVRTSTNSGAGKVGGSELLPIVCSSASHIFFSRLAPFFALLQCRLTCNITTCLPYPCHCLCPISRQLTNLTKRIRKTSAALIYLFTQIICFDHIYNLYIIF